MVCTCQESSRSSSCRRSECLSWSSPCVLVLGFNTTLSSAVSQYICQFPSYGCSCVLISFNWIERGKGLKKERWAKPQFFWPTPASASPVLLEAHRSFGEALAQTPRREQGPWKHEHDGDDQTLYGHGCDDGDDLTKVVDQTCEQIHCFGVWLPSSLPYHNLSLPEICNIIMIHPVQTHWNCKLIWLSPPIAFLKVIISGKRAGCLVAVHWLQC